MQRCHGGDGRAWLVAEDLGEDRGDSSTSKPVATPRPTTVLAGAVTFGLGGRFGVVPLPLKAPDLLTRFPKELAIL
jgi:hypothetical protein